MYGIKMASNAELEILSESSSCHSCPSSSESDTQSQLTLSILDKLKPPTVSDLHRKRKTKTNTPATRVRRKGSASSSSSDPKSISPSQRVREHPDEPFKLSQGKLFCYGCREELNLKSTTVSNHIKSKKHQQGKVKLQTKEKREREIADALAKYNQQHHGCGETLPHSVQVYRIKVVSTFLRAGVPLSKIDCFRSLLEETGYRLTDKRHLFDTIPFILNEEEERLKQELLHKDLSVVFDGTTRLGEALAVVARLVTDDWSIEQRLIRLKVLSKSLVGDELAREIIDVLSITYGIRSSSVIAIAKDGASVNGAAMRTISVVYPDLVNITCFSHMLNRVGEHFVTPNLSEFTSLWISLFSHSSKAKLLWKSQTGKAMASYSPTRWWSKWEVQRQILEYFGDIEGFLRTHQADLGRATGDKLIAFFDDIQKKSLLQLELAAVIDCGEKFVTACYTLEGDSALSLSTYEVINSVVAAIGTDHWPNLSALSRSLSSRSLSSHSPENVARLTEYGKSCVSKGCLYFQQQLSGNFKTQLAVFKAAQFFSPHQIQVTRPTAAVLQQELSNFPFLKPAHISKELPVYLAKSEGISSTLSSLEWWKNNSQSLPNFSQAARKVLLLLPSSGPVERVFSLLNSTFSDKQETSLFDYVEASVMLQYNKH